MSDQHTPDLPAPDAPRSSSVVLDTNATVKKSRLGVIVAVVAVVAFVGFSVAWFATREDYTPGPAAQAVLKGMEEAGVDIELSDDQLRCIDDLAEGIDPAVFETNGIDPMNSIGEDAEYDRIAGRMLDDCFDKATRVALFGASLVADGTATEEQADCAGTALDDAFLDAGGYEATFTEPDQMMGLFFGLFGAMSACGIDLFGGMDEPWEVSAPDFAACDADFSTVSTALEAYQADNGKNAETWDDLSDLLSEDYSYEFTIEAGSDGSVTLTGIGDCEGYSFGIGA